MLAEGDYDQTLSLSRYHFLDWGSRGGDVGDYSVPHRPLEFKLRAGIIQRHENWNLVMEILLVLSKLY